MLYVLPFLIEEPLHELCDVFCNKLQKKKKKHAQNSCLQIRRFSICPSITQASVSSTGMKNIHKWWEARFRLVRHLKNACTCDRSDRTVVTMMELEWTVFPETPPSFLAAERRAETKALTMCASHGKTAWHAWWCALVESDVCELCIKITLRVAD